jgi:penicillin-binding protein 1A
LTPLSPVDKAAATVMRPHLVRLYRSASLVASGLVALALALYAASRSAWVSDRLNAAVTSAAAEHGFVLDAGSKAWIGWSGALVVAPLSARRRGLALRAEQAWVHPSWTALLRGELRPVKVGLADATLDIDLAELATRQRSSAAPKSTAPGHLELALERTRVRVHRGPDTGAPTWEIHSLELSLAKHGQGIELTSIVELPSGGRLRLRAQRSPRLTARLELRHLTADDLPLELTRFVGAELQGGWSGEAALDADRNFVRGRLAARLATKDLVADSEILAPKAVGPLALAGSLTARWDLAQRRLDLEQVTVSLGAKPVVSLEASGSVSLEAGGPLRLSAHLAAPEIASVIAALPPVLRPPADAPQVSGALTGQLTLEGPWREPLEWVVQGKLDLSALRARARERAPPLLAGAFRYHVPSGAGHEEERLVGPENPDFVPLAELPRYVADAVVTSEDGGFWGHQGFDFDEIKLSLLAAAASGHALRGGSTITQQLAKNLFLSPEKTYARKVREAFVTLALESSLSKSRLLEIYLNIIEWGPGIWGIGPAARAYFGKDARELTPREAVYLASVIPNPVRYYVQCERGQLSPAWSERLDTLLARMSETGRLDPDAYVQALKEPLVFRSN